MILRMFNKIWISCKSYGCLGISSNLMWWQGTIVTTNLHRKIRSVPVLHYLTLCICFYQPLGRLNRKAGYLTVLVVAFVEAGTVSLCENVEKLLCLNPVL